MKTGREFYETSEREFEDSDYFLDLSHKHIS